MTSPVNRASDDADVTSGGILYVQLGDTVYSLGKLGALLGRLSRPADPNSEKSENIAAFTTDKTLFFGPADRPDVPIEVTSFRHVTIRHHEMSFVGGMPPSLATDTVGTGSTAVVEPSPTYMARLRLTAAGAPGASARVDAPLMRMVPVSQYKIGLWTAPSATTKQVIEVGLRDASGANAVVMQRVDSDTEGQWWGVVRVNGVASYTSLIDPTTALPYRSGTLRKFLIVAIVSGGARWYAGEHIHNKAFQLGSYSGALPSAAIGPFSRIETTDGSAKSLYHTAGAVVWPG